MSLLSNVLQRKERQPGVDMAAEMKRRKTRRLTLLDSFQRHGDLTTKDLQAFGTGVSSRIKELRKEGHIIVPIYERPGLFRYYYKGKQG